jgi:hypothetical protein
MPQLTTAGLVMKVKVRKVADRLAMNILASSHGRIYKACSTTSFRPVPEENTGEGLALLFTYISNFTLGKNHVEFFPLSPH